MKFKDKDLSPELDFVGAMAEEESLLQAFRSSVVESMAQPCNSN
jgi:hypothetical protein